MYGWIPPCALLTSVLLVTLLFFAFDVSVLCGSVLICPSSCQQRGEFADVVVVVVVAVFVVVVAVVVVAVVVLFLLLLLLLLFAKRFLDFIVKMRVHYMIAESKGCLREGPSTFHFDLPLVRFDAARV